MTVDFGIGVSDFAKLINSKFTYIDKSLWIKELLEDGSDVLLFPRPRRFGKTLNMTMLRCFLDIRDIEKNKDLFKDLKVSQYPEIMKHQGQYPVIYISLKEIKKDNYKSALAAIGILIQTLFASYQDLRAYVESEHSIYLSLFDRLSKAKASEEELVQSLKFLSMILEKKYNQKVWILIDEYDTPIHAAWEFDFYKSMKILMQGFLGSALKDNTSVYKSILTGIMRVSKEGLFSDLNNIKVHSMLSERYCSYFGFTDLEVDWICEEADLKNQREPVREWYNGYQFGELSIYNPWSIINFATEKKLAPYWVKTGSSQLIEDLMAKASDEFKFDFEALIQGRGITKPINENISLPEINDRVEEALWSFLLFSGYLKIVSKEYTNQNPICQIQIPNEEIKGIYEGYFASWLRKSESGPRKGEEMFDALLLGNVAIFSKIFTNYLQETLSYFDLSTRKKKTHPEKFYHALVLGMLVYLKNSHQVISNRESGTGRYDVMIIPKDVSKLGVIIEFKVADSDKTRIMNQEAEEALKQIDAENYQAELNARGIKKILKLAIVFYGKKVLIKI